MYTSVSGQHNLREVDEKLEDLITSSQPTEAEQNGAPQASRWWNLRLLTNLFIITLPLTLLGYDLAITGPLLSLPFFIKEYQPHTSSPAFTAKNLNFIVTVPICGSVVALLIAPSLLRNLGRKRTLLVGCICFCAPGSFLQLFAPTMATLVCGISIKNVGVTLAYMTAPLYISELVPTAFRGRATGLCTLAILISEILGATLVWGTEKLDSKLQYKIPYAIEASLACIYGFITFFLSESPVWYLLQDQIQEAEGALNLIRSQNPYTTAMELAAWKSAIVVAETNKKQTKFYEIFNHSNLWRTIVACAYRPFNQVSGRALVTTFATVILVQSGVADAFRINILIICLSLVAQLIGPHLIDKVGRRPVVLFGMLALLMANVAIGTLATVGLTSESQRQALAALFVILQFVNVVTFGSIVFLLPVELPTTRLREPTLAWSQMWNVVTAIAIAFAVPQMITADAGNLGAKAAFVFAGCNILMLAFSYFYLPETKDLAISDIDMLYAARVPARQWTAYMRKAVQAQSPS